MYIYRLLFFVFFIGQYAFGQQKEQPVNYDDTTLEKQTIFQDDTVVFIEKLLEEIQQNLEEHRAQNFLGNLLQHQTLQATKFMSKWIEEKNK